MARELTEGEPIEPATRRVERDALKWEVVSEDGDEVTFRAGTEVFECHKSGVIYREWEKEARRREAGGALEEPCSITVISTQPVFELFAREAAEEVKSYAPMLKLVDSQIEERELRIGDLRKKAALMDWCNHEVGICTGKCKLLDEIRDIEKKILGDP
jgi:hypothetical protein